DLGKSIELNDGRAAYRGRLLLDKDRAARGTSLARAYNDLGFEQLGHNESTDSLTIDPANASAHRFLSDTYRGQRRRELSRLSELYQAQMLQDINVNPVQPSISNGNLNIVTLGGPATPGFSEFTPLFQQNEVQADVSAAGGSNDTYAGEAVVTVLHDRYSLSMGAMKFKTDGFRDNNDQDHEIYDVYAQADVTPVLNVQGEYNYRHTTNGDLAQNFDPDDYNSQYDRTYQENTARLGARLTPSTASTVLLSVIYSDRHEDQDYGTTSLGALPCAVFPPPPFFPPCPNSPVPGFVSVTETQSAKADRKTWQYEGQYLYQAEEFNITAGGLYADNETNGDVNATATLLFTPPIPSTVPTSLDDNTYVSTAYVYSNLEMLENMVWTAGLNYTDATINFKDPTQDDEDFDRYNPKLGLQWNLTDALDFRAAWFKTVTPVLANKRMLEPTQVAGFSQLYDEAYGTKATNYGGGLDWRATDRVFLGGEMLRRNLRSPTTLSSATQTLYVFQDEDEWHNNVYAYWMPTDRWGLSAEVVYDKFESDDPVDVNLPLQVRTWSYPVKAQYFHPSGYFGAVGVTYVDQQVKREPASTYAEGTSHFTVTDVAVGYRLPRRQGILSLAVQNVFDQDFDYQDDSYRTFENEPSIGPYIPDRSVMARVTLNF
ncbi:MAG TPA: TonB-dependent receptor, partial [Gammaproteobacteria bacterium]|nr:TonB-dependent receptor [Gammaproteobacteria bacterium]